MNPFSTGHKEPEGIPSVVPASPCLGVPVVNSSQRPEPDSNRRVTVLQTVALPLGYRAVCVRTTESYGDGIGASTAAPASIGSTSFRLEPGGEGGDPLRALGPGRREPVARRPPLLEIIQHDVLGIRQLRARP